MRSTSADLTILNKEIIDLIKILADTHTHTNCSTHAHSTLEENIAAAKRRGLELLCMTNHTPGLPDSPHIWHFHTMHRVPKVVDGVRLMFGAEANIIDKNGNIDLSVSDQKRMDIIIASIHRPCYIAGTREEHTATYIGALKNPYVTIIGHSGSPAYEYDIDTVVKTAREYNKCMEINNSSFIGRPRNIKNCRKIALACKKYGTKITVGSDAHSSFEVGVFDGAVKMLEEIDFPEELIMNSTAERFENYVAELKSGIK